MKPLRPSTTYILLFFFGLLSCSSGGDDPVVPSQSSPAPKPEPEVVVPPPSKASLSFPENNKTCETGTEVSETQMSVVFKWNAATNATAYDLRIVDLNNQSVNLQNNITATEKSVTLTKGNPYSWQITSKATGSSVTETSELWKFYLAGDGVSNHAPFPASLISPASGSTVAVSASGTITLSWEAQDPDGDALVYSVYLDTVNGTQEEVATDIDTLSFEVSVEKDQVYYWRVKSSDGQNSSFSQVYGFRTGS